MNKTDRRKIRTALAREKRSQKWLADELGVDASHVSKWLTGVYDCPKTRLDAIRDLLGIK